MPVIEISSLSHPGVEMFCTLTGSSVAQSYRARQRVFFYRRKPKGYHEGSGCRLRTFSHFGEHKHITGDASDIIERCSNVLSVHTGERELRA